MKRLLITALAAVALWLPVQAQHYCNSRYYDPETDSELKISIPEDTDIMFCIENRRPVKYSTSINANFKDTPVTLYRRVEEGDDGYYISYAGITSRPAVQNFS